MRIKCEYGLKYVQRYLNGPKLLQLFHGISLCLYFVDIFEPSAEERHCVSSVSLLSSPTSDGIDYNWSQFFVTECDKKNFCQHPTNTTKIFEAPESAAVRETPTTVTEERLRRWTNKRNTWQKKKKKTFVRKKGLFIRAYLPSPERCNSKRPGSGFPTAVNPPSIVVESSATFAPKTLGTMVDKNRISLFYKGGKGLNHQHHRHL